MKTFELQECIAFISRVGDAATRSCVSLALLMLTLSHPEGAFMLAARLTLTAEPAVGKVHGDPILHWSARSVIASAPLAT